MSNEMKNSSEDNSNKVQEDFEVNRATFIEESAAYANNIRKMLKRRLIALQIIGAILIIYLFTLPFFSYISEISEFISVREEAFIIFLSTIVVLITLFLLYFNFKSKFSFGETFTFLVIVVAILSEPNSFFLILKLLLGLFLFELPRLQSFYNQYFDYYSSYPNTDFMELHRLRLLFDKHIETLIYNGALLLSASWISLFILDQISIRIGNQGSFVLPLLGLVIILFYLFYSPRMLLTLRRRLEKNYLPNEKDKPKKVKLID